ncbi:MAG: hypothetical protein KA149_06690 [Chitinophagales bacterium]|nr:hypothetical protein [Chitinophagales bacterium]
MLLSNSRTVKILKALSSAELDHLESFIQFSTANKSKALNNVFIYLKNAAPTFAEEVCNKKGICKHLFKKTLSTKLDKEINRLVSELKEHVEKWIVYKFTETQKTQQHIGTTLWYLSKNLLDDAQRKIKEIEDDIFSGVSEDTRELYLKYMELKITFNSRMKMPAQNFLLFNHYTNYLKQKWEIEHYMALTGEANSNRLLNDSAIEFVKKNKIEPDFIMPDIKKQVTYFKRQHELVSKPNVKLFHLQMDDIKGNNLLLSQYDKQRGLTILSNCVKQIFKGESYFEQLEMIRRLLLDNELKTMNGRINTLTFESLFKLLLYNNKTEEARALLLKFNNKITGIKDFDNYHNIYMAMILYAQKKYADALQLISNCYAENTTDQTDILVLKVKAAYSLKNKFLYKSHLSNLRKFISVKGKHDSSTKFTANLLALLKHLTKLFNLKQRTRKNLEQIKANVLSNSNIYNPEFMTHFIDEELLLIDK